MIIELATSLVFLASSINSTATTTIAAPDKEVEPVQPITLEDHVKEYFKDAPILAEIAKCESNYRHFNSSGSVIRGKVNKKDVGLMQINEFYHASLAKKLGYDIYTLDGNMAYAEWLYKRDGVKPWSSSEHCWDDATSTVAMAEKVK